MDLRGRYRELVLIGALVAGAALALATGGRVELVDGLSYDIAVALRPSRASPTIHRVAVIAIDYGSLSSKLLESTPRVFFSPYYAELVDGLFQGGAKAVGFDVIFYAASRFPAIEPSYDVPLLNALGQHRERTVLARTEKTRVAEPFVAAVFDPDRDGGLEEPSAIAYSELVPSEDGVQRWVYSEYSASDGTKLKTLAARLAEIAGGRARADAFLLSPAAPLESLPTYAFVDVLNCIKTSPETVRAAFADKVVLIGGNLPEEDRKRASDRFIRWPSQPAALGDHADHGSCKLAALGPSAPGSDSVPGVHIHAAAVDSLLAGTGVTLVPTPVRVVAAAAAAVICASLGLFLSPVVAVGALGAFLIALFGVSILSVAVGHWLPIAVPATTALGALLGGQLARFFVEDRRRRRLEKAFGCYLAPAIVTQLGNAENEVQLGGEEREVTVMFADLTNFTAISDTMSPADLMGLTNSYFRIIVEVIDEMGGYVDKFIGDAVMALWGAPAKVTGAPALALESALRIQQRVQQLKASQGGRDIAVFDAKVGISTGPAIVGNVGAPKRLSYTALGATINLAARLEKVCSTFGCRIVVDSATMGELGNRYLFCELDAVTLKGKRLPVAVYEAIARRDDATPEQRRYVLLYQAALQIYRAGELQRAANLWTELDALSLRGGTSAARIMAQRAMTGEPIPIATPDV